VDYLVEQLKKSNYRGILGINIGKNKDTENEKAVEDYLHCFRRVYPYASYVTVNISPLTQSLTRIAAWRSLNNAFACFEKRAAITNGIYKKYVPLVVKIAPDLNEMSCSRLRISCSRKS